MQRSLYSISLLIACFFTTPLLAQLPGSGSSSLFHFKRGIMNLPMGAGRAPMKITSLTATVTPSQGPSYTVQGIINAADSTVTIRLTNKADSFYIKVTALTFNQVTLGISPSLDELRLMTLHGEDVPMTLFDQGINEWKWTVKFDILNASKIDSTNFKAKLRLGQNLLYLTAKKAKTNLCITILDDKQTVMYFQPITMSDVKDLPIDVSGFPSGNYTVLLNHGLWHKNSQRRPVLHFYKP